MGGQGRNAVSLDIGIKLGILRTFERTNLLDLLMIIIVIQIDGMVFGMMAVM